MRKPIKSEPDFSSKDIVQFLLEKTETLEPPTNAEAITDLLQLRICWFSHHQHNLDQRIRAYLLPARREIGIARNLSPHRRKFSILHEVGHYVNPGHWEDLDAKEMLLDDDNTLRDHSVVAREAEANRFAADCIFQLNRFQSDVSSVPTTWSNISEIARIYDTSVIATARRWVEFSPEPCALLVFVSNFPSKPSSLRFSYLIASRNFKETYFARLTKFTVGEDTEVFRAFRDSIGYTDLREEVSVEIEKELHRFEMALFSTPYGVYGLIEA